MSRRYENSNQNGIECAQYTALFARALAYPMEFTALFRLEYKIIYVNIHEREKNV